MKSSAGRILHRLIFPIRWVAVRGSERPRVLVIVDDQILLVRVWIDDGRWSLPGGGKHRSEESVAAAQRELREETGIEVQAKDLKFLGMADVSDVDVRYESPAFAMHLSSRPKI